MTSSRDKLLRLVERLEAHAAVEADSPYCNNHVENLCSEAAAAIRGLLEQKPVGVVAWSGGKVYAYALPVAAPAQAETDYEAFERSSIELNVTGRGTATLKPAQVDHTVAADEMVALLTKKADGTMKLQILAEWSRASADT
jgi:hypothetical protein